MRTATLKVFPRLNPAANLPVLRHLALIAVPSLILPDHRTRRAWNDSSTVLGHRTFLDNHGLVHILHVSKPNHPAGSLSARPQVSSLGKSWDKTASNSSLGRSLPSQSTIEQYVSHGQSLEQEMHHLPNRISSPTRPANQNAKARRLKKNMSQAGPEQ